MDNKPQQDLDTLHEKPVELTPEKVDELKGQSELMRLKAELAQAKAANAELRDSVKDLTAKLFDAKDTAQEAKTASDLQQKVTEQDEKIKALMLTQGKHDREMRVKQNQVDELKKRTERLNKQLREKETSAVTTYKKLASDLQVQLDEANRQLAAAETNGESAFIIESQMLEIVNGKTGELDNLRNDGWQVAYETIFRSGTGECHKVRLEKRTLKAEEAPHPSAAEAAAAVADSFALEEAESVLSQLRGGDKLETPAAQPAPTMEDVHVVDFTVSPFSSNFKPDASKYVGKAS